MAIPTVLKQCCFINALPAGGTANRLVDSIEEFSEAVLPILSPLGVVHVVHRARLGIPAQRRGIVPDQPKRFAFAFGAPELRDDVVMQNAVVRAKPVSQLDHVDSMPVIAAGVVTIHIQHVARFDKVLDALAHGTQ